MKKMTEQDGSSFDIVNENLEALKAIFPEAFTEDGVDFEVLRQLLGDGVVEGEEKYGLNWHGKKKARQIALMPSLGTLRPCPQESVDWDTTQNLFIEGDNLEVLKLLQKSYANKVKMIYIDPPYNTGKEFIYPDKFQDNLDTYLRYTGQKDETGFKLSSNTESSGRFHTNWLNMMCPRLKLARSLLRRNGILFMSIGQAELANAVAILDQIFGEENRISICTRMMKSGGQKGKFFSPNTDYVLVYAKWLEALSVFRGEISQELQDKVYNQIETDGNRKGERYRGMGLFQPTLDARPNQRYYIQCSDGSFVIPPGNTFPAVVKDGSKVLPEHGDGVWRWTPDRYFEERKKGNLLFKKTSTSPLLDERQQQSKWNIYTKIWLKERLEGGSLPLDIFDKFENRHSSKEIAELEIPFDFAKPTQLLSYLMQIIGIAEEDIVLDFFAGSCSTAHALFNYRIQSHNCIARFICVQLPEKIEPDTEAARAGFKTIAEIGKERIRRAAAKIKEENPEYKGDLGFKVFKLNSSNIRAWNPDRNDLEQTLLDHMEHLVEGRGEEDVLYELLLKRGVDLTVPIEEKTIAGKTVYSIGYGALFACLDTAISREEVEGLAQGITCWHKELEPASDTQVVFRDSAFANDIAKTNMTAILEQHGIAHVHSL